MHTFQIMCASHESARARANTALPQPHCEQHEPALCHPHCPPRRPTPWAQLPASLPATMMSIPFPFFLLLPILAPCGQRRCPPCTSRPGRCTWTRSKAATSSSTASPLARCASVASLSAACGLARDWRPQRPGCARVNRCIVCRRVGFAAWGPAGRWRGICACVGTRGSPRAGCGAEPDPGAAEHGTDDAPQHHGAWACVRAC